MKSNGSCHGGAWEVKLGRWSASVMFPEGSGCQDLAWLEKAMVNTGQGRGEAFMEGSSGKDQGGKDVNCCYCFSRIQANAMTFHFFFFLSLCSRKLRGCFYCFRQAWQMSGNVQFSVLFQKEDQRTDPCIFFRRILSAVSQHWLPRQPFFIVKCSAVGVSCWTFPMLGMRMAYGPSSTFFFSGASSRTQCPNKCKEVLCVFSDVDLLFLFVLLPYCHVSGCSLLGVQSVSQ